MASNRPGTHRGGGFPGQGPAGQSFGKHPHRPGRGLTKKAGCAPRPQGTCPNEGSRRGGRDTCTRNCRRGGPGRGQEPGEAWAVVSGPPCPRREQAGAESFPPGQILAQTQPQAVAGDCRGFLWEPVWEDPGRARSPAQLRLCSWPGAGPCPLSLPPPPPPQHV